MLTGCKHSESNQSDLDVNYCHIIEKVINAPQLNDFYHFDLVPERTPLTILTNLSIKSCPKIKKNGYPIKIINVKDRPYLKTGIYLELNIENKSNSLLRVNIIYKTEGIKGYANLEYKGKNWTITDLRIIEQ